MTKGRDLPPLLPLEYCRLDRAARLLGCEVEDIIHWGAIGAIRLCVLLDMLHCRLESMIRFGDDIFPNGNTTVSIELTDSEQAHLDEIIGLLEQGPTLGKYSVFHLHHIREGDNNGRKLLPNGGIDFSVHGSAGGLWEVPGWCAADIEKYGQWQREGRFTRSLMLFPANVSNDSTLAQLSIFDDRKALYADELWILRPDLEKIYGSLSGDEKLPNIYNNDELAKRAGEQDIAAQRARTPRTSHPQSEMIRALLLLHPTITEAQLTNPHKLHGVLTEMFKASKGKAVMPDVHPNTFERWLKATTNR